MTSDATSYPTLDEILAIHARSVELFGGSLGIRDHGLLDSALHAPAASFGGEELHPSLAEKAGAYAYHLIKNHTFVDGKKRTGLAVAAWFLRLNGSVLDATDSELVDLGLGLADGTVSKASASVFFASHGCAPIKKDPST